MHLFFTYSLLGLLALVLQQYCIDGYSESESS